MHSQILSDYIPGLGQTYGNTSILFWLSQTHCGQMVLRLLFEKNKTLVRAITEENLCQVWNAKSSTHGRASILYGLSRTHAGLDIFAGLFSTNINIIKKITPDAFYGSMSDGAEEFENTCVFYNMLLVVDTGYSIIARLFQENPILITAITAEVLCRPLPAKTGPGEHTSALFWLSYLEEGCNILQDILKPNPELKGNITYEALFCRLTVANTSETVSAFYNLSRTPIGHQILLDLFMVNDLLGKHIDLFTLSHKYEQTKNKAGKSAVDYLITTAEGRGLLTIILRKNPIWVQTQLFDKHIIETLCKEHPYLARLLPDNNESYRFFSSANADGSDAQDIAPCIKPT